MDKATKRKIQRADRYVRNRTHKCLFPRCNRDAVRCHSIQRAALVDALAVDGKVFTLTPSYTTVIGMKSPSEPLEISAVGVNIAGTFYGYCNEHDHFLFDRAETSNPLRKNGMTISLHIRALSLEYCRKRTNSDFFNKLSKLSTDTLERQFHSERFQAYSDTCSFQKTFHLDRAFSLIRGNPGIRVDYFCMPFSRNLHVSCCGAYSIDQTDLESTICYNLISLPDCSFLVLTSFRGSQNYVESFLGKYNIPGDMTKMVNDIAFKMCENPLISPILWNSIGQDQQYKICMSIRPPWQRTIEVDPRAINLAPSDFVSPDVVTLAALSKKMDITFGDMTFYRIRVPVLRKRRNGR